MPLINEESLARIAHVLRSPLERLTIGGVNEWNSTFSNGYGLGDANTLVIDMRPHGEPNADMFEEASGSRELLNVLESIGAMGVSISFIDVTHKPGHPGFIVVMRLRLKDENVRSA
jgi:hypothetical protein